MDFSALLSAVRPPEASRPARAAQITVREGLTLPAAAGMAQEAGEATGDGSGGPQPSEKWRGGDPADGFGFGFGSGSGSGSGSGATRWAYILDQDGTVELARVRDGDGDGCEIIEDHDGPADTTKDAEGGDKGGDGDDASTKPKSEAMEVDGPTADGKAGKDPPSPTPGAADTSASGSDGDGSGSDSDSDSDDSDADVAIDTAAHGAYSADLPLESLPGRPTISFRRAEADQRLAALLRARSVRADEIVRGLARRHVAGGGGVGGDGATADGGSALSKQEIAAGAKPDSAPSSNAALAGVLATADSVDGELSRRLRLEKARLALERPGSSNFLSPDLHEVEIGDWETKIDWDGLKKRGSKSDAPASSGSSSAGAIVCVPQTASSLRFANGAAKAIVDPKSLLSTPYNPDLDAMDFSAAISWLGADAPPGYNTSLARSVPLLLEMNVAGKSVALHAGAAPVRPTPFGSSSVYEGRYERDRSSVATSTATSLGSSFRPDGDKLEAIIKYKQERRAMLATKKSHRIMEALGTLGLGGGKGRTITSSLMGPGGTERTGRVSRGVGGSLAHDSLYVEQADIGKSL